MAFFHKSISSSTLLSLKGSRWWLKGRKRAATVAPKKEDATMMASGKEDGSAWRVHTLLKGLEKTVASADIPMLVCGDFNSVPGSAPHALLAFGKVDPMHQDLAVDPLGILRPATKLTHTLPLVDI
ncbi:unnamed protein product [Lactuca virosa]|uniref:Endonuclease/exonuclease/phosphatase domain-containing protein n=1 Tax=Lactuca virosa TaxID=75947 RepID=A0AAU9M0T8_9ASTR|nr:unnamed protein product [Lactuca virosa]